MLNLKQISPKFSIDQSSLLGKGSTGNVYLGYSQHHPNKKFAIKSINLQQVNNQVTQYLLSCEIVSLKELSQKQCPFIVKLYDLTFYQNHCYLIMELLEGGPLSEYIKNKDQGIEEQQAIILFKQLYQGYKHIKNQGIVHRDIKPDNLIFRQSTLNPQQSSAIKNKTLCFIDFGYCTVQRVPNRPQVYYNVGSPKYMSPQAYHQNIYSQKSDIWALGIILYQMIHGKTIDTGMEMKQYMEYMKKNQVKVKNGISEKVKELIKGLLKFQYKERMDCNSIEKYLNQMDRNQFNTINQQQNIQYNQQQQQQYNQHQQQNQQQQYNHQNNTFYNNPNNNNQLPIHNNNSNNPFINHQQIHQIPSLNITQSQKIQRNSHHIRTPTQRLNHIPRQNNLMIQSNRHIPHILNQFHSSIIQPYNNQNNLRRLYRNVSHQRHINKFVEYPKKIININKYDMEEDQRQKQKQSQRQILLKQGKGSFNNINNNQNNSINQNNNQNNNINQNNVIVKKTITYTNNNSNNNSNNNNNNLFNQQRSHQLIIIKSNQQIRQNQRITDQIYQNNENSPQQTNPITNNINNPTIPITPPHFQQQQRQIIAIQGQIQTPQTQIMKPKFIQNNYNNNTNNIINLGSNRQIKQNSQYQQYNNNNNQNQVYKSEIFNQMKNSLGNNIANNIGNTNNNNNNSLITNNNFNNILNNTPISQSRNNHVFFSSQVQSQQSVQIKINKIQFNNQQINQINVNNVNNVNNVQHNNNAHILHTVNINQNNQNAYQINQNTKQINQINQKQLPTSSHNIPFIDPVIPKTLNKSFSSNIVQFTQPNNNNNNNNNMITPSIQQFYLPHNNNIDQPPTHPQQSHNFNNNFNNNSFNFHNSHHHNLNIIQSSGKKTSPSQFYTQSHNNNSNKLQQSQKLQKINNQFQLQRSMQINQNQFFNQIMNDMLKNNQNNNKIQKNDKKLLRSTLPVYRSNIFQSQNIKQKHQNSNIFHQRNSQNIKKLLISNNNMNFTLGRPSLNINNNQNNTQNNIAMNSFINNKINLLPHNNNNNNIKIFSPQQHQLYQNNNQSNMNNMMVVNNNFNNNHNNNNNNIQINQQPVNQKPASNNNKQFYRELKSMSFKSIPLTNSQPITISNQSGNGNKQQIISSQPKKFNDYQIVSFNNNNNNNNNNINTNNNNNMYNQNLIYQNIQNNKNMLNAHNNMNIIQQQQQQYQHQHQHQYQQNQQQYNQQQKNINHQNINHQNINHQNMNHQNMNHQNMNHQNMNHQNMNHQNMNHQNMNHIHNYQHFNNNNQHRPQQHINYHHQPHQQINQPHLQNLNMINNNNNQILINDIQIRKNYMIKQNKKIPSFLQNSLNNSNNIKHSIPTNILSPSIIFPSQPLQGPSKVMNISSPQTLNKYQQIFSTPVQINNIINQNQSYRRSYM